MIVPEKDALARLNSPLNLINRLSNISTCKDGMSLFGIDKSNGNGNAQTSRPLLTPDIPKPEPFNPFAKPASSNPSTALAVSNSKTSTASSQLPADNTPPTVNLDSLLDNADSKIKLAHAHDKALDTLVSAVDLMKLKLDDIKPDKLPSVIAATSKVVDQIQRQRIDMNKNKTGREVHYHFYTPNQKTIDDYEVIDVDPVPQHG